MSGWWDANDPLPENRTVTVKPVPVLEGRCATCRFWEREYKEERGECALMTLLDGDSPRYPESKAIAHSSDGVVPTWAMVETAPDFGCVQYELDTDPR